MASDVDASCENDPNFAVICAFFEKFGENCGLGPIDFSELQSMLENTEEVPPPLANLLIKLMRKVRKTVKPEKWEKALVGLCHNFSSKDAWEIERFGFKKAKLSSKVRALKELLEMQFDFNVKFKGDVNKLTATELRSQPLGRDKSGHAYWFHSDHNFQIRVYKEDLDDETWTLIAKDRESLVSLITKLNDGEVKCSSDSAVNEDSNSLSEKLIIDTGQIDSDSATGKEKSTEDDVEQTPKKMKIEDDVHEEKVLKIHLTDIQKSPTKQDCDTLEKANENEELKEEEQVEEHQSKKSEKEDSKKDDETSEADKAKKEDSEEEEEETSEKSPIVGDTIEEDTMYVQGEGSGKESETGNENATTLDESPIVGEVIEEEIMHIRGEGSGEDCETGNDEKASVNETQSGDVTQSLTSSSTENSIRDDGVDEVNKGENVPKIQLDAVVSDAKMSSTKVESEATPEKKPTFFFGSPQKETSVTTSLTMEFGQKPDQADKSPGDIVEKGTSHISLEEKHENHDDIEKGSEVNQKKVTLKADDTNQDKEVLGKNDDGNPKKDEPPDKEDSSNNPAVVEELCVKKHAYVCGEETAEENEETVTEKQEVKKDDVCNKSNEPENCELGAQKPEIADNEVKSKETTDSMNVKELKSIETKPDGDNCKLQENKSESDVEKAIKDDSKTNRDENKSKDVESKADDNKIEQDSSISKPEETESKLYDESTIKSDKSKPSNASHKTNKDENKSDGVSTPEKTNARPGMALRAVRTKRAVAQSKSNEKPSLEEAPAKDEKIVDTEVIYVKSRRGKKEREVTPPTKTKNVKKPKLLVKDKNKKEDKVDSDNASVTSGSKAGKGSMASASSSRVSTPVSMPDSIITIPEITEVTSVEEEPPVLEKDPLGCSDDDQDDETGPAPNTRGASLQNFSFDYEDTAAAPAIPVIPNTRSLRKRGREASPVGRVVDKQQGGKKMKLKGKRRFNTKLRRSIEQQKQQLQQSSSSDEAIAVSSDEAPKPPKEIPPKKKRGRKKKSEAVIEVNDDSSNQTPTKVKKEKKPNARMLEGLGIIDLDAVQNEILGVRQSRRLAQIKIKESLDTKKPEPKPKQPVKDEKSKKKSKEIVVPEKKKHGKKAATPEPKVIEPEPSGRRRKKRSVVPSKLFDQSRPWRSSSESSEEEEEAVEEEEEEEVEEKLEFNAKSDHEFSPESDLESGEEYQAPKRARTAKRKEDSAEEEDEEDFPCQKCGKSDHPEWILLCDKCENGWHCSCLRPPLLSIPEGDWFCPPCEHIKLIENLQEKLEEYDKNIVKKNLEDRRKERLAYVGISLNNVLPPTKDQEKREKIKKKRHTSDSGSSESGDEDDDAESETDSDEPVYQLRQRRQARSYKFNEYDDLINSAIQDQLGEPVVRPPSPVCGRGKDMATIVKAEQEERKENDVFKDLAEPRKDTEGGSEGDEENKKSKPSVKPSMKKPRKKPRKMTALDVSSEDDDERDEDFIGDVSMSSEDEDVEEEDSEEDSDDIGRRRRNLRPVRRSTRTRASKIDKDFITDDDDDSDRAPRKKKKKHYFSDDESSESDGSWGRRRKKGSSKKKKSKKKNSILDELSDLEVPNRKKKRRIVYGGLTSSEEELGRGRRTRGKKTTYVEALGSETEDEVQKRNPRKIDSDDEDFVANEEDDEEEAQDEDEPEPDEEEDKEEEDMKKDTEERRRLVVPKIYIKKPAAGVVKETDKGKKVNSEANKPEDKTDVEQNGKEPEADKNNEAKEKPALESEEKKSILTATNNSGRVRIKVVPRKENASVKPTNLQEMNKQSENQKEKDLNKNTEKDSTKTQLSMAGNQLASEKKKSSGVERINMKKVMSSLDKAGIELTKMPASEPLQKAATTKSPPQARLIRHEPIVSNVNALLKNDDSNDELSEPPGVALPVFDEVTITKKEAPRRRIKIRPKKSLEETVAHLGSAISIKPAAPKPADQSTKTSTCKIEIAAPPQPFSQTAPAPSIITRMLQTPSGTQEAKDTPDKDMVASSAESVAKPDYSVIGKIRPKQFATMPLEDDDDEPAAPPPVRQRKLGPTVDSQDHFVQNGGRPGGVPPPSQYHHRLPPAHPPPPMNHYPPHQPPPHEPTCGPSGAPPPRTHHNVAPPPQGYHKDPPQAYHKEPPPPPSHVAGTPTKGMEGYGRTQQNRYNNPGAGPAYPLRPPVHMPHPPSYPSSQPPTAAHTEPAATSQPPPPQYYGSYPPPPVVEASAEPPYQNHPPYQEGYGAEVAPPVEEPAADNSKSYDADETGGEFGGLVSYFSSQHEDDLDS